MRNFYFLFISFLSSIFMLFSQSKQLQQVNPAYFGRIDTFHHNRLVALEGNEANGSISVFGPSGFLFKKNVVSFDQYNQGFLIVHQNWRYFFIDSMGNTLGQKITFDECRPFDNDYAIVKNKNLWGLVDKSGKLALTCKYQRINGVAANKVYILLNAKVCELNLITKKSNELPFSNMAKVNDSIYFVEVSKIVEGENIKKYFFVNSTFRRISDTLHFLPDTCKGMCCFKNVKYDYVDAETGMPAPLITQNIICLAFEKEFRKMIQYLYFTVNEKEISIKSGASDTLKPFFTLKNGKFSYLYGSKELKQQLFDTVSPFYEGYAVAGKKIGKLMKYGIVDMNGKQIVPFQYHLLEYKGKGYYSELIVSNEGYGSRYYKLYQLK